MLIVIQRDPQTHLKNATMFWDYLSTNQESAAQVMRLFSDRGTPYSYRHMHGFSGHVRRASHLVLNMILIFIDFQVG